MVYAGPPASESFLVEVHPMSRLNAVCLSLLLCGALTVQALRAQGTDSALPDENGAVAALKKAASYYREKVASHGGYVYYYSTDLTQRWGEGRASADTIFVQPPGTPSVGMAYLEAFEATGDSFYLDAARETAKALVNGQLQSGGWTQVIHFTKPERGQLGMYRKGTGGKWNNSTLDDGQTQAALQCLITVDQALDFENAEIHESVLYGLDALLSAQFPNGAFPQVWSTAVQARPVRQAQYPSYDWKTEGKIKNYWDYYTLNDDLAGTVADVLILAHQVYSDEKYAAALARLGDFLILAQMPDPQPGWCQQYNYDMVPMWARKFEPPAITAWESQDVIETLIKIARHTGDKKYLDPIPAALTYFTQSCLLPDGQVARYYELRTNKPLYMDADYQLTYDDSAPPSHYGWKQPANFDTLSRAYIAARDGRGDGKVTASDQPIAELGDDVRRIIGELDQQGRWVTQYTDERLVGQPKFERGFRYISSDVFNRNLQTLSEYIKRLRKPL